MRAADARRGAARARRARRRERPRVSEDAPRRQDLRHHARRGRAASPSSAGADFARASSSGRESPRRRRPAERAGARRRGARAAARSVEVVAVLDGRRTGRARTRCEVAARSRAARTASEPHALVVARRPRSPRGIKALRSGARCRDARASSTAAPATRSCSTRPTPRRARRHRARVRLGARARAAPRARRVVLAGGLDAGERAPRRSRGVGRGRSTSRRGVEAAPGHQGPRTRSRALRRQAAWRSRERRRRTRAGTSARRRPLRARDADAAARRARGARMRAARARPGVPRASSTTLLRDFVGRPTPLYRARRGSRRRSAARGLPQARGPAPHRRAQDQQHARPGAARAAHGQAAHHRRDRRRPARRRDAPPRPRCSASSASSTWARRTCARQALNVAAHEAARRRGARRRRRAAARSRTRSTRRMRDWVTNVATRTTCSARCSGRIPTRRMVRDFQRVIGARGARAVRSQRAGRLPDVLVACVGGGSNAIGLFHAFLDDASVRAGRRRGGRATASRPGGTPRGSPSGALGVLHGTRTLRAPGRATARSARRTRSRAGLDYPGVGPEHALAPRPRAACATPAPPTTRRSPRSSSSRATEGIMPALETAHALAVARCARRASSPAARVVIVNLSGRGDKDVDEVLRVERDGFGAS